MNAIGMWEEPGLFMTVSCEATHPDIFRSRRLITTGQRRYQIDQIYSRHEKGVHHARVADV